MGGSLESLVASESLGRLRYFARDLERHAERKRSVWIAEGLEAIGAGESGSGATFAAEATMSRYEIDGADFYTIILRSVSELQRAEEEIRALRSETQSLREQIEEMHGTGEILGTKQSGEEAFRVARVEDVEELAPLAQSDAQLLLDRDGGLAGPRGQAARICLYLFERDQAVGLIRSG